MKIKYFLLALVILCSAQVSVYAQDNVNSLMKRGNKLFKLEQYRKALPFYEKVLEQKPGHADATFKAGVCYLHRYSKEKALEYILKARELDSNVNKFYLFWLGRAYHSNYEFDKALEAYTEYQNSLKRTDQRNKEVEKFIRQVNNAKEFVRTPQNFIVKNLGPVINTSFSEHSPVVSENDSILYFTSRRETPQGKEDYDGEFFEDVYKTIKQADGSWSKPEPITLNTSGHDASIQLYDNDSKMLLYRQAKGGDIYYTEKVGEQWLEPVKFANINTRDFEADAFITEDGKTAYFATNHYKQKGDLDIYVIHLDDDGNWSKPKELGGVINSNEDEDAPFITPDGNTLYFSSRGHKSMGGFDVFKSTKDEKGNWTEPVNMGHPINTPDDDVYFYFSGVKNKSYMASYREGGYGEKDIYEILPISKVIVKGNVVEDQSEKEIDNVSLKFTSLKKTTTPSSDESKANRGTYEVNIFSHNTYKVEIFENGTLISTQELEIPHETDEVVVAKDFVVPFKERGKIKEEDTFISIDYKYVFRNIKVEKNISILNEQELDLVAAVMKKNPAMKLNLTVDEKVGQSKADMVLAHLKKKGVNTSNIQIYKRASIGDLIKVEPEEGSAESLDLNIFKISGGAVGSNFILRNVHFETAKAVLTRDSKDELSILAAIMKMNPGLEIEIQGYTDSRGSDEVNLKLSENRAKSVYEYLVSAGIDKRRLKYKGFGKENPVADNNTEEGRLLNRRTEVKILKK
ncbi:MAG: OmpA family protein [Cytophagaceae bacterium]